MKTRFEILENRGGRSRKIELENFNKNRKILGFFETHSISQTLSTVSSSTKVTNPNPLCLLVCLSNINIASSTSPNFEKYLWMSSCTVVLLKPPTKIFLVFVTIFGCPRLGKAILGSTDLPSISCFPKRMTSFTVSSSSKVTNPKPLDL